MNRSSIEGIIGFMALLLMLTAASSGVGFVWLVKDLEPTAKGIVLGAIGVAVVMLIPLMGMILYAIRSREADKQEFLSSQAKSKPPTYNFRSDWAPAEPRQLEGPSFQGGGIFRLRDRAEIEGQDF